MPVYQHILIALENSPTDRAIIEHIGPLVKLTGAELSIIHVADGFVARNQEQFNLEDSEEMAVDRAYLEAVKHELEALGCSVTAYLAQGDPAREIVALAKERRCDLIAMATHGHRLIGDVLLGSVASAVRHSAHIPVLLVPGQAKS
jgi:nucleotide-binding universal stress UspA family protein